MEILYTVALAIAVVATTILLHYEVLRGTSLLIPKLSIPLRSRILVVIGAAFVAHILEICLYAFTFFLMQEQFDLGEIAGQSRGGALDFFYFSISSYTTLGFGDLYPSGPLRLIAGLEALNGLVLIGWTASFTYLSMAKFWDEHGLRGTHLERPDDRQGD